MPPAGTFTLIGLALLTVQLAAIPESATFCVPACTPENVTLPFVGIDWLLPAALTVTVYPDGGFGPLVVVLTVRLPLGGAAQVTANAVDPPLPAATFTLRGLLPLTVQLDATPVSSTE